MIRITVTSVFVDDQARALAFYTDKLGFAPALDIPVGECRWLTVVSPADPEGTQLLLEPNDNEVAATFQKAIFEQGIAATTFTVDDIHGEYERLVGLGVRFVSPPTAMGPATLATLDDTCGNLISLNQVKM